MASSESGGYDHKFVDPPDDLICLICKLIAREPHQVNCCGKVFCKSCIDELQRRSKTCPNCRKRPRVFNDRLSERRIKTLRLSCENEESGCQWLGKLEEFHQHMENCEFTADFCPNDCCSDLMVKAELESHMKTCPRREHECPICKESGPYEDMISEHPSVCPEVTIACPNKCGVELLRRQLEAHLSACPREVVPCSYAEAGCDVRALRQNLRRHMTNAVDRHQFLAMGKIANLERIVDEADTQLRTPPFTFKVENFAARVAIRMDIFRTPVDTSPFQSPCFYTHRNGYKMYVIVTPANVFMGKLYVDVNVYLTQGHNDSSLSWPFKGDVEIGLLNQSSDEGHILRRISFKDGKQGDDNGTMLWVDHRKLKTPTHRYLKDDCLYFCVYSVSVSPTCKPWLTCTSPKF